jgi:hypothetical protein
MAGARVRDGGGPISDVQRLAREHAQRIAVGTLFNPVARIEAVQAMSESASHLPALPPHRSGVVEKGRADVVVLLAAFSENGWLPGGKCSSWFPVARVTITLNER